MFMIFVYSKFHMPSSQWFICYGL